MSEGGGRGRAEGGQRAREARREAPRRTRSCASSGAPASTRRRVAPPHAFSALQCKGVRPSCVPKTYRGALSEWAEEVPQRSVRDHASGRISSNRIPDGLCSGERGPVRFWSAGGTASRHHLPAHLVLDGDRAARCLGAGGQSNAQALEAALVVRVGGCVVHRGHPSLWERCERRASLTETPDLCRNALRMCCKPCKSGLLRDGDSQVNQIEASEDGVEPVTSSALTRTAGSASTRALTTPG